MKLTPKSDLYEISFSSKKDPLQWSSFRVDETMLLLKMAEVLSSTTVRLECVALVATAKPNKHSLPTP